MNRNSYLDGELLKKQILAAIQAMSAENSLLQNLLMYYFEIYNDVTLSGATADNIRTAAYIYVYLISVNIQVNEKDIEDLRKAYDIIPNEHFDGDFLWTRRDEVVKEREQNLINLEKAIEGSESKSPTIADFNSSMIGVYSKNVENCDEELRLIDEKMGRFDETEEKTSIFFYGSAEIRKEIKAGFDSIRTAVSNNNYTLGLTDVSWMDRLEKKVNDKIGGGNITEEELESYYNRYKYYEDLLNEDPDGPNSNYFRDMLDALRPILVKYGYLIEVGYGYIKYDSPMASVIRQYENYKRLLEEDPDGPNSNYYRNQIASLRPTLERIGYVDRFGNGGDNYYKDPQMVSMLDRLATYEKYLKADPTGPNSNYFRNQIDSLKQGIINYCASFAENANHSEEFTLAMNCLYYDQHMSLGDLAEIVMYWKSIDNEDNLLGKEMPKSWMREHLNPPPGLNVNEDNYDDMYNNQAMKDWYYSSYYFIDIISGQPTVDGRLTSKDFTYMAQNYRNGISIEDTAFNNWYEYTYGAIEDYSLGLGTVRAVKYALEKDYGFDKLTDKYGYVNVYTNDINDYYRSCVSMYLNNNGLYDEYTNSKGKGVSANDEYQLLEYLKSGDYTRGVTEEERRILEANYNAYVLGNVAEYKSLNALADQMVEEFNNQDNTFVTCDGAEIKRLPNGDYVVTYTMSKCDLYDEDYNEITHISMYFSAEDIECGIYVKKEAFMREVSSIYADCVDKDLISLEVKLQREKDLETMKGMINEYILSEEDKQKALEIVEQNYYENYILTEVFGKDKKRAADISKENWEKAKNATLVAVAVASLVFPPSWFVSTGALIISLSATTADYIHTNFIQGEDYANIEKNSVAYAIEAAGELLGYGFEMYNLKVDKALKPTKEMLSKADDLKWTPERIEKTMQNIDSLDDVFVKYSDDVITKTDDVVKAFEQLDDAGRVVNKLDDVAEIANEVDDVYQGSLESIIKNGTISIDDIKANPSIFSGKSVDEIAKVLRDSGYDVTVKASTRSRSGAQIIKINNPGGGKNISQVQVSPGGGRHGSSPYVKISTTDQGIIKIIDGTESLYKTDGKETATIIFSGGK